MHTYICTYIHTDIHAYIHIHTYTHTNIHTYIQTYIRTHMYFTNFLFDALFFWLCFSLASSSSLFDALFALFVCLFLCSSVVACSALSLCPAAVSLVSLSLACSAKRAKLVYHTSQKYTYTQKHTHKHIDSSILSFVHRERPLLLIRSHSLVPWTTSMLTLNLKYIHTNTACHRVAASTSTHWQQQQRRWRWRQRRRQRRHLQAFGFCYFCRFLLLFALVPCVICLRFLSVFWHVFRFAFFRCSFLLLSLSLCCSALCFVL